MGSADYGIESICGFSARDAVDARARVAFRLMFLIIAATLFMKAGASFMQSRAGLTFDWATDGALEGISIGAVAGVLSVTLPRVWRAALAGVAPVVALVLTNLLPVNPYFDIVLADWRQGRYLHFNGCCTGCASIRRAVWTAANSGRSSSCIRKGRGTRMSMKAISMKSSSRISPMVKSSSVF